MNVDVDKPTVDQMKLQLSDPNQTSASVSHQEVAHMVLGTTSLMVRPAWDHACLAQSKMQHHVSLKVSARKTSMPLKVYTREASEQSANRHRCRWQAATLSQHMLEQTLRLQSATTDTSPSCHSMTRMTKLLQILPQLKLPMLMVDVLRAETLTLLD